MAKEIVVDRAGVDGKVQKILVREKEEGVIITQISADGTGVVFGLGNDQKVYVWHHSLQFKGSWVQHINFEPSEKKKEKGEK